MTQLAERRHIKLIIPPVMSGETRLYDFTNSEHLSSFQEQMIMAYKYISSQVAYMHTCKANKARKGGYDGRSFPPGLAVERSSGQIVVYKPWADEMKKLALRAQALDWNMAKLNREVNNMALLFPEPSEDDRRRYLFHSTLGHIPGVGYKPFHSQTIKGWLTNIILIGWWQPNENEPDVIVDNHPAVLDRALFEEGYAALTGYTLEGEPARLWFCIQRTRR